MNAGCNFGRALALDEQHYTAYLPEQAPVYIEAVEVTRWP